MTADSYSPTKEQIKDVKMVNTDSKNVVLEVEDRHYLFRCFRQSQADKATQCIAELVGTAVLVFLICMGCLDGMGPKMPPLQTAIASGTAVLGILSIFGGISHCHINPAVTLSALIFRIISFPLAILYMICQIVGGIIGFGLLRTLIPKDTYYTQSENNSTIGMCMTFPTSRISSGQALSIEICITILLIWLVCAVWDSRNSRWQDSTAIKFGFTIVTLSLAATPFTGAGMNPARSLPPAIFSGNFDYHWVYWVGPMIGSLFSSLTYKYIFHRETPKCCCTIAMLKAELTQ